MRLSRATIALGLGVGLILLLSDRRLHLAEDVFNGHKVILDSQGKIVPWFMPAERAYDHFLRLRWRLHQDQGPQLALGRLPVPPIRSITSIAPSGTGTGNWSRTPG